jgi:cytoplasmic iron level regulating protein YaaA (DUF328/UPF0246 family)
VTSSLEGIAHALDRIAQCRLEMTAKLAEAERDEATYYERRAAQIAYERTLRAPSS